MSNIFEKYPLPWEVIETLRGEYVKAANDEIIVAETDDFDDKAGKLLQGIIRLIEISDDTNDVLRDIARTLNDKFYGH